MKTMKRNNKKYFKGYIFLTVFCIMFASLTMRSSIMFNYLDNTYTSLVDIKPIIRELSPHQEGSISKCISNYRRDKQQGLHSAKRHEDVRWNSHYKLHPGGIVIEIGGYLGRDTTELYRRLKPRKYIVLEPVTKFYKILKKEFRNNGHIEIYNYGLSKADNTQQVHVTGDSTSVYKNHGNASKLVPIKTKNSTTFFREIITKFGEIDLLTVNCEGCEYEVLDSILSTTLVYHIKRIQFQTHILSGISRPVERYCRFHELLKYTHEIDYSFKFTWECWVMKTRITM